MLRRSRAALAALVLAAPSAAHAAASDCDAAFETSELQLRPGAERLLEARESLRACAQPTCQRWMVDDCTKRLVEVEGRIPSIVFSAADGNGRAVYDVRVREGERELGARIDGRAVEIEPGPHAFVAEHAGQTKELDVVVLEGRKAQQVVFTFPQAEAGAPPPTATTPRPAGGAAPPDRAWARPLALGLGAGALVAVAFGSGFGISAVQKKEDARCAGDVCQGSPDGALAAAHASTASFVVAGALAAGGLLTFLVFGRAHVPAPSPARTAILRF